MFVKIGPLDSCKNICVVKTSFCKNFTCTNVFFRAIRVVLYSYRNNHLNQDSSNCKIQL